MNFALKAEQFRHVHIHRLYANEKPTLILVTDEEAASLSRHGATIDHAGLKSLLSTSPSRLEMLRDIQSWVERGNETGLTSGDS